MMRGLIVLIIAFLLGIGMFLGSQRILKPCDCVNTAQMPIENGSLLPELQWLRLSLDLTSSQFEKVKALHLAYQPKCVELCKRVRHSDQALQAIASGSRAVNDDVTKLLRERAALTQECQQAMLKHVYETAACMAPEQADKYLKTVLPHVLGTAHVFH